MIRKIHVALTILALAAGLSTASAQTLVWSDDFDDNNPIGWALTSLAHLSEINQQFMVYGYFGPLQTNNPTGTHAAGYHSIPTSGPLPDNQTLELRADLLGTSENDAWADLHFLWLPAGQGYILFKDEDEVALCKFYNGASAVAWFIYESGALKNENVTLVLALTRRGSNLEITTRVLDKDNANALLFERTVTDTPQADPVLPDGSMRVPRSAPDPAGTPWPITALPGYVELSVTWANAQRAPEPDGFAGAMFDNLAVWQYESPQLTIHRAVVLSWPVTQGQFVVDGAASVTGPWTPIPAPWCRTNAARNEVCVLAPEALQFFRLRLEP
jgi:hypothetical protein